MVLLPLELRTLLELELKGQKPLACQLLERRPQQVLQVVGPLLLEHLALLERQGHLEQMASSVLTERSALLGLVVQMHLEHPAQQVCPARMEPSVRREQQEHRHYLARPVA